MTFQRQLSTYNLTENLWRLGEESQICAFTEEETRENAIYAYFFLAVSKKQLLFLARQMNITLAKLYHLLSFLRWREFLVTAESRRENQCYTCQEERMTGSKPGKTESHLLLLAVLLMKQITEILGAQKHCRDIYRIFVCLY